MILLARCAFDTAKQVLTQLRSNVPTGRSSISAADDVGGRKLVLGAYEDSMGTMLLYLWYSACQTNRRYLPVKMFGPNA